MSSIEQKVATYRYFADEILPVVKASGYTVVQIMAIMEHAYYASFGYHVTNFFAVSSRSGTPDDFKYLVDKAHGLGLYVLIDLIHSHASSNVLDGINQFDGTDHQYFHGGIAGTHKLWESRLFNYSHWEVIRFLLSNLSWWMEEYHVDGFRYDAVTSILYKHHGIEMSFTGNYNEYFGSQSDCDGIAYLMLANLLIHTIKKDAITIAEDVSGMPGLCRPLETGGIGFDLRLFMSVPDKWIKILKEGKDETLNIGDLVHTLTNRRYREPCVVYMESHDQAIVGDKTAAMWLFGNEIYYGMGVKSTSIVVERGMALHKMMRLLTFSLGGEAYLNFMGNEFGHPEWIDFPREGNKWSYYYCRRRWDLRDNPSLKFQFLRKFDIAMMKLDDIYNILNTEQCYVSLKNEGDKVIAYEKGILLFIFNFHPSKSYVDYKIGMCWNEDMKLVMTTDQPEFDGKMRIKEDVVYPYLTSPQNKRPYSVKVYIPARTAIVLTTKSKYKELIKV